MRLVSESTVCKGQVFPAPTHTCTSPCVFNPCQTRTPLPAPSVHMNRQLSPNINYCWCHYHIFVLSLSEVCHFFCCCCLEVFLFCFHISLPLFEVCGKVENSLHRGTSQEACLSVGSTRVTAGDLREDRGGLRLQARRRWISGAASLCCLKFWQLRQQNNPVTLGWSLLDARSFGKSNVKGNVCFCYFLCNPLTCRKVEMNLHVLRYLLQVKLKKRKS